MNELLSYIQVSLRTLEPEDLTRAAFIELGRAIRDGAPDLGVRTAKIVEGLLGVGEVDRAHRLIELVVNLPDHTLDVDQHANLHLARGLIQVHAGEVFAAVDEFSAARVKFEMAGDTVNAVRSVINQGRTYGMLQQWALCQRAYETAIELSRKHGLHPYASIARHNLAIAMGRQGRWRTSLEAIRFVGEQGPEDRRPTDRINAFLLKGRILRHLGWSSLGAAFSRRALTQARGIGFRRGEALACEFLGDSCLDRGQHRRAIDHFKAALKIGLETAPEGDVVCEAYRRLAEAQYMKGDTDACKKAMLEAWRLAEHLHDDYERVAILRLRAGLALEAQDFQTSDTYFREATALCIACGFRFEHALTLEVQAFAHQTSARPETAQRYLTEAMELYQSLGLTRLARRLAQGERALSRRRPARRATGTLRRGTSWEKFGIYSRSPVFLRALDHLDAIARSELPVLVVGESGVGKELIARAIHRLSGRTGEMVDINCPAIPETMLESELFGSRRGAFTGAEDRPGLVSSADGGTLFLDEIGDMPHALQVKLLRFVETSTYRRVGGRSNHRVDVRLISATNADLDAHVRDRQFRLDLFHRIAASVIELPPLRERPEDIEFLSDHFLRAIAGQNGSGPTLDREVEARFRSYEWPGNVRELMNVLASAVIHVGTRKRITLDMLPDRVHHARNGGPSSRIDAETISSTLVKNGGRISDAARELGISRQTLYRRIDELGVDVDKIRGR